MRVNWSDLPKDLLASISGCLETDIDILRFRSVCTSWRSSVPPVYKKWPIQLPVWVSPNDRNNKEIPGYFSLTESIICRLERVDESSSSSMNQEGNASSSTPKLTGCWLVKVQKKTPEKMRILPLLSNYRICHLPEFFPKVINSSNFHISVISKAYDMEYKQTEVKDIYFCGDYYSLQADKVVLSSNPAGDYAFMALHSGGRLGFLSAGDHKWSVLNDIWTCYEDIISYEGGFCAVDILGKAVAFDLSFKASDMAPALGGRMGSKKNLVEMKSTGDLLLVVRYSKDVLGLDCCTIVVQFKVYKLNRETQRWNEVKNLGDEALFVGKDCSFSVSVQDFPGLKGNCIFYNEQAFRRRNKTSDAFKEFLSHDTGVCNLEDGTLRPLAAYPQCCSLFWPPSKLE